MRENELYISNVRYDLHTVQKVVAAKSTLAEIRIHEAEGGYLLTFYHCICPVQEAKYEFMQCMNDVKRNKWIF